MADDKDLEKAKAAAAAKAKAAAAAKAKAAALAKAAGTSEAPSAPVEEKAPVAETKHEETAATPVAEGDDLAAAKAKAVAAAKAKAAAAAAAKAKALGVDAPASADTAAEESPEDAKAKAIAAAKAKAAAAAAAKAKAAGGASPASDTASDDPKAAAIAAAKAKAAAVAAAKAKAAEGGAATADAAPEEEKPSQNRPLLDLIVKKITEKVGANAIEESYINFLGKEVPTLVIRKEHLIDVANLLYNDEELDFKYLSNLHGIDHETHMEVYYFLQSYSKRHFVALRTKTDREGAKVPSVTSIWFGANWQEREAYDLLGIDFEGHPNMKRMFLPENWVGHPLRKDYVQYDEEV